MQVTRLKILLTADERPNYVIGVAAGISPSQLSSYARGDREISVWHRYALAEALGVPAEALDGTVDLDDFPARENATDKQTSHE